MFLFFLVSPWSSKRSYDPYADHEPKRTLGKGERGREGEGERGRERERGDVEGLEEVDASANNTAHQNESN